MIDKSITCCFTGHRQIPKDETELVRHHIEINLPYYYDKGYRHFIVGGAVGFDMMAAIELFKFRKTHDIKILVYVPCEDQDKFFSAREKEIYRKILNNADIVDILQQKYTPDCMLKRNRKMVDDSSLLFAYFRRERTGTSYTKDYAIKNNVEVIYL